MYRSLFPRDLFAEMDRLQREMQQAFDLSPTIRGLGRGGFPALNVGSTPSAVEVYAFAPGLDPSKIDINLDRGLLTISGERESTLPSNGRRRCTSTNASPAASGASFRCPKMWTPSPSMPAIAMACCTSSRDARNRHSRVESAFNEGE
jgi:hypothetical protein